MFTLFRPATTLMVQYAHYHRDRRNIFTHLIGIPLIVMAVGMLLVNPVFSLGDYWFTPAGVMWFVSSLWYLSRGAWLLGVATVTVNGALMWAAYRTPVWTTWLGWPVLQDQPVWLLGLAVFFIGWVIQFIGHWFEGRKPAFVDDVVGLMVGPMFVVGEVLMALGLLRRMHHDIHRLAGSTR
jgi:uncharacterized membrane protein YGL010W